MKNHKTTNAVWSWTCLVLPAIVGGMTASATAADKNLIYNGSFEVREPGKPPANIDTVTPDREDLIAWLVTGKSVDWIGPKRWKASHGSHCIDIDAPGGILQEIRTTPGKKYRLTFDMAGNVELGPAKKTLTVTIAGNKHQFTFDATGRTRSNLGWVRKEVLFTAKKKRTKLAFTNASKQPTVSGVALDNVVVRVVGTKGK